MLIDSLKLLILQEIFVGLRCHFGTLLIDEAFFLGVSDILQALIHDLLEKINFCGNFALCTELPLPDLKVEFIQLILYGCLASLSCFYKAAFLQKLKFFSDLFINDLSKLIKILSNRLIFEELKSLLLDLSVHLFELSIVWHDAADALSDRGPIEMERLLLRAQTLILAYIRPC